MTTSHSKLNLLKLTIIAFVCILVLSSCQKQNFFTGEADFKIIYMSQRTENSQHWHLYMMNKNGSNQERITDSTINCSSKPILSHSGKTILFVHYTEEYPNQLLMIDIDGTNLKLIDQDVQYCGSPSWTNDDSKILYSKRRDSMSTERDIVLYDIASGAKIHLTYFGDNYSAKMLLNESIIYCHSIDIFTSNVYNMNMDGTDKRLLIANACNPTPSPDNTMFAYQARDSERSTQIFTAMIDGSDQKMLTSSHSSDVYPGWPPDGNHSPVWTLDSKNIVFVSWEDSDAEIHIMDWDGNNNTKLTKTDHRDEYPSISPDGSMILFSSKRKIESSSEIYTMTLKGNRQKALSKNPKGDIKPIAIY